MSSTAAAPAPGASPLRAGPRFLAVLATWALIGLSMPGVGRPGGFGHVAFVALVPWALAASRPGRRAFLAEWLGASVGLAVTFLWMRPLLPGLVPLMGLVPAVWIALGGVLLRRLARRRSLAVAVPLAWLAAELVRWHLEPPLSFGWWRLGMMAHDTPWLAGSARVFGTWGLTYVFAAFAGWLAELVRRRPGPTPVPAGVHAAGLGPLALAVGLSVATAPPPTRPGPRVLLVQTGIEQERKSFAEDPLRDLFLPSLATTAEGLAALAEPPDLVAWGETALPFPLAGEGALAAYDDGARVLPWTRAPLGRDALAAMASWERACVDGALYGRAALAPRLRAELAERGEAWSEALLAGRPLLPPGTSFFTGAEVFVPREGALRRQNVGFLWDAEGRRSAPAPKVHLVPGAEDPKGFQRFEFVLDAMEGLGGYVPDFVAADATVVLPLEGRDGRSYRVGVTVCYDNVFDDPYTGPLRAGPLDLHLVASNEAWYRDTVEMDHMIAFSRLLAVATGRAVVRATNSGISAVLGPDGADVALLTVEGRRKMVRGTLAATVPVPVRDARGRAPRTPFVRFEQAQLAGWVLLIAAAALLPRRRDGYRPQVRA